VLAINICLRQPYFTMREQVVALSKVRKFLVDERVLDSKRKGGFKLSDFKRFAIKDGRALTLEYLKEVVINPEVPIQKEITKQTYALLQDLDHVLVVLYYADGKKNRWVHSMANLKIGSKTGKYSMMILDPNNAAV
jgi:hypothetical protein